MLPRVVFRARSGTTRNRVSRVIVIIAVNWVPGKQVKEWKRDEGHEKCPSMEPMAWRGPLGERRLGALTQGGEIVEDGPNPTNGERGDQAFDVETCALGEIK